ncbi:hypothetical protein L2Y96_12650 [Luteibacter aegosomaticola]|uniref:hypothetical protein n=1 Tax=Luteibacter aegosomaticola TaxID=2911538 RepID=UPI001FFBD51E|nr:hypothetical protein [Luteibacter aegosomaticola]UPG88269.1 hypothetical protein L2Y96_12650 [Luteibacter aegosomaticola]
MNTNLTLRMGNCNHRNYIPRLVELVRSGQAVPTAIVIEREPLSDAIGGYKQFDKDSRAG